MLSWETQLRLDLSDEIKPTGPIYNHTFIRNWIIAALSHRNARYFYPWEFILTFKRIFRIDQLHRPTWNNIYSFKNITKHFFSNSTDSSPTIKSSERHKISIHFSDQISWKKRKRSRNIHLTQITEST